MAKKLLALEGLSKYYTGAQFVVMGLNNISVSFDRGEFVAITGESGSGKSTLAHVLGGILPYESGEMLLDGKPTSHFDGSDYERYRRDNISFISQNYGILPGCTVLENVVSALRLVGMEKPEARRKAKEILMEVELWELKNRRAAKLSSGQKQRLSIARALAKPAPILIADEPTGNLDPENSAKVIRLLAHAARERLVILITHEFQEAADHVTRHVVIQDGRIAMDSQLRPAAAVEETTRKQEKAARRVLSPYISRLQLGGRPVWSTLVLLFFALTAFAVFAFLGTFIVNIDDTSTRIYDNSAFFNGNKERIVVGRGDGGDFTQEDYEALSAIEHVVSLERYGYVADISYGYREGVDYDVTNDREYAGMNSEDMYIVISIPTVRESAPFIQTVPVLPEGQEFLTAGRLPENINEVVMAGSESQLGKTMTVYIRDHQNWGVNMLVSLEVTVVGVTDHGQGLYFHDHMGRAFTTKMEFGNYVYFLFPNGALKDFQCRVSDVVYVKAMGMNHQYLALLDITMEGAVDNYRYDEYYITREFPSLEYQPILEERARLLEEYTAAYELWLENGGAEPAMPVLPELPENMLSDMHEHSYTNLVEVSPGTLEHLTLPGSDQVSIYIEDYAYADRVLEAVQKQGYMAFSPFQTASTRQNATLAEERMQTLTVCALALLAVVVLQVIVLRALFAAQTESYKVLSNMGLACGNAKRSILWQVLLFTVLGQLVGYGGILACREYGVERIVYLMRYLPPAYIAILGTVHLAASLAAALWIMSAMSRQVYPLAGKESDMEFEEEEGRA